MTGSQEGQRRDLNQETRFRARVPPLHTCDGAGAGRGGGAGLTLSRRPYRLAEGQALLKALVLPF